MRGKQGGHPATDIFMRVPPHDVQAEVAILGAVLIDQGVLDDVLEVVEGEDFYQERHRAIFESMLDLHLLGEVIDAITLTDALRSRQMLEVMGGPVYLAEIAAAVPIASNAVRYARIVREKAALRRLLEVSQRTIEAVLTANGNAPQVFKDAETAIGELVARRELRREPEFADLVAQAASLLEKEEERGVPTGFGEYDRLTGGMCGGEMVLLAGLTSRGKTTYALNVALNLAKAGHGVLFVSCEMPAIEMAGRYLYQEAQIVRQEVRERGLYETEAARVERAVEDAGKLALAIRYRPGCRPREVVRLARQYQRSWGGRLRCVVVDYIQLMRPDRRAETREAELSEIAMTLKQELAGDLDVSALVLAQLNRQTNKRDGGCPHLDDLRGSGALEQHADTVCFIWSEQTKDRPDGYEHQVMFTVAKSRNGPVGEFGLRHRPKFLQFEDIKREDGK